MTSYYDLKVHNVLVTDSKDIEVNEMPDKKLKRLIS